MNDFHGFPIQRLSSEFLELDCLATAGPRIVRLRYKGSGNLLAEVPGISVPTPYGDYHYLGGHRLWHAPEGNPRSYIPDEEGLVIAELPHGIILDGRVEPATGIQKRLEIHVDPDQPRVTLTHTLSNKGLWPAELSPWAITMLHLGGTAILPIRGGDGLAEDLLPNRHFSLWPYSHIQDPRLHLEDEFIVVRPRPGLPPFKIGTFNARGWTAYWLGDVLFLKTFTACPGLPHPDFNCNAEIYCDEHFIELESLGPLTRLAPGDSVSLVEIWQLFDSLKQGLPSQEAIQLLLNDER